MWDMNKERKQDMKEATMPINADSGTKQSHSSHFKFSDLFAGIGGFRIAAEALGGECVFSSEIDRNALRVYSANFEPTEPIDMTKCDFGTTPDVDIVFAGFPCQSFSHIGYRRGFDDIRGTLFWDLCRYIAAKSPQYFVLENVKNLLRHDDGRTIDTICDCLENELQYRIDLKILKSQDYGVPQPRPRVYIVGWTGRADFEWPEPIPLTMTMSDILKGECSREIGYTLRQGGYNSPIDDRHNWNHYWVNGQDHALTWKEALTMQGFPEDFILPANVSEHIGIKLLGNAITVNVAKAVTEQVLLLQKKQKR
jgi:DNA (cytosine-5)-methyltransferase 1